MARMARITKGDRSPNMVGIEGSRIENSNIRMKVVKIGAVQEIPQPFGLAGGSERPFLVLASFQLSYRSLRTCSFAEASPKPKNPRSEWPRYFLKRSSHKSGLRGLKNPLSTRISRLVTRINPLKQSQVVDFPDIEENKARVWGSNFRNAARMSRERGDAGHDSIFGGAATRNLLLLATGLAVQESHARA